MHTVQLIFVGLVAFLHFYFMLLETYFWARPKGMKIFKHSAQKAQDSKVLAMNQGLYNGILAVGLIWTMIVPNIQMQGYLLSSIVIAGVVGGLTVVKSIFYVQALPALVALTLLCVA